MTDLRIMTFNIRHGLGMDGRVRLDRVLTEVEDHTPAVVCLQEVDRWVWRSSFRRQEHWLARRLGMGSAFGPSDRIGVVGRGGNAVLVDGTVKSSVVVPLPRAQRGPRRSAVLVEVDVAGVVVHVVAVHLAVAHNDAIRQLEALVDRTRHLASPVILAGDLNMAPGAVGPVLERCGFRLAAGPATFRSDIPRVQIDHVAIRGGTITATGAGHQLASDHVCLVADVSV